MLGERVQILFGEDGTFLWFMALGILRGTLGVFDMLNRGKVGLEEGITSIGIVKSQLDVGGLALVLRGRCVIARRDRAQARVLVV